MTGKIPDSAKLQPKFTVLRNALLRIAINWLGRRKIYALLRHRSVEPHPEKIIIPAIKDITIIIPARDRYLVIDYYRSVLDFGFHENSLFLPIKIDSVSLAVMVVTEESSKNYPPQLIYPIFRFSMGSEMKNYLRKIISKGALVEFLNNDSEKPIARVQDPAGNKFDISPNFRNEKRLPRNLMSTRHAPNSCGVDSQNNKTANELPVTIYIPGNTRNLLESYYRNALCFDVVNGAFQLSGSQPNLEVKLLSASQIKKGKHCHSLKYPIFRINMEKIFYLTVRGLNKMV